MANEIKLTEEQQNLLIYLGSDVSERGTISAIVHGELVQLGMVHQRDDGEWHLTDAGRAMCDKLAAGKTGK